MGAVRLESITLKGFQSYRDEVTVPFDPRLTLLAGRNNVGKSALLRALRLPLDRSSGCHDDFALTYRWRIPAELFTQTVEVGLQPDVPDELLFLATFERTTAALNERGEVNPADLGCRSIDMPEIGVSVRDDKWGRGPLQNSQQSPKVLTDLASGLSKTIAHLAHRRIQPGRRGTLAQPYLMPDGQNLTELMIHIRSNRPSIHSELMAFMKRAFPEIETVTATSGFTDADRGQAELTVFYAGAGDTPVPLTDCGTGIEQMLAVGSAIFTTEQPHVFLIDEPQLHLHPHAERSLLQLLDEHAHHQYIVATHSPSFLRAQPLSRTRLVTMTHGTSHVVDTTIEPTAIFQELGLTGADLWLAERIVWVEGDSDVSIVEEVLKIVGPPAAGDVVRALPLHTRFSSASARTAQRTFEFCARIASAVSPLPIEMVFLFDSDEKSDDVKTKITEVSGNRARFLPCREIENLLLDPKCITEVVQARAVAIDLDEPEAAEVEALYETLLSDLEDGELYPAGPPTPGERREDRVRGSVLLKRLYWELLKADYGKAQDGPTLAALIIQRSPERLAPLLTALGYSS